MIDNIVVPHTSAQFDHLSNLTISGQPSGDAMVFYADNTTQAITTPLSFHLSTTGLDSILLSGGQKIDYSSSGGSGLLYLGKFGSPSSLEGELLSFSMEIIDPLNGLFEGSGFFDVTGGSLASDFGASGGLASIGLSFRIPADFNSPFWSAVTTTLYSEETAGVTADPSGGGGVAAVPESGSTTIVLGLGLLFLGLFSRYSKRTVTENV